MPAIPPSAADATEPLWLAIARSKIGTAEAPGALNNPTILGWAAKLGVKVLGIAYNADSTPWCGVFVATCFREAGVDLSDMRIGVRASSWANWGTPVPAAQLAPGAVLVFQRPGGGHVGFYAGEDTTHYHVVGGNQGDKVSRTRIEKSRCIARRWPAGLPKIGKPLALSPAGLAISKNEA